MNNTSFKILGIIFIIKLSLIRFIDSTECTSSSDCSGEGVCIEESTNDCTCIDNECLLCNGLSSATDNDYYKVEEVTNGDEITHSCVKITESSQIGDYKYVYDTKFFKSSCPDETYDLDNICFSSPQDNWVLDGDVYKCNLFKSKESINDLFEITHCINDCYDDYNYYDGDNKVCLSSGLTNKKIKVEQKNEDNIIRYTDQCTSETEYEFSGSDSKTYCFDKCENYSQKETKTINGEDFISIKCLTECSSFIIVDTQLNALICSGSNSCDNNYPNKYTKNEVNYCLKTCQDSNIDLLGNDRDETYLLEDSSDECSPIIPGYYLDELSLKLIKDCTKSISGPYNNGRSCKTKCEKNVTIDKLECVDDCDREYETGKKYIFDEENICYIQCPGNLGRGYTNMDKTKCQSCNNPVDPSDIQEGEGYLKSGDKTCKNECDSEFFHNYKDNFCSNTKCEDRETYKYTSIEYPKTCYESCSQIGSNYKYEKGYICYINDPTNGEAPFYLNDTENNIIKIFEDANGCLGTEYKFLRDNNCVKNCSDDEYKILPDDTNLGKCLQKGADGSVPNECVSMFYNETKICKDSCSLFTILDTEYISNNKINCIEKCPTELYENGDKCSSDCGEKFYIESPIRKCVDQCDYHKIVQITGTESSTKKICVDECIGTDGKKIFYDSSGKCVDSCKDITDFTFSYNTTYNHQPCINKCPDNLPYYYDDNNHEKICLKECDKFYKNNNDKMICTESCDTNSIILPGNICSSSNTDCPNNAPFKSLEDTVNNIIRCVESCPSTNPKYKSSTKKCVRNCEATDGSDKEIYSFNNACYEKCPDGLYIEENNECVSNCQSKLFKRESDQLKCITTCESDKYITTSGECVDDCPIGEIYIEKKDNKNYCLTYCVSGNKFYEKFKEIKDGDTLLYTIYKCLPDITSCKDNQGNNKYSIDGTKECISSCGNLYEYEENGTCYSNCINLPGKSFSYTTTTEGQNNKCINSCRDITDPNLPYFGSNHVCVSTCEDFPGNKTINDDDGACVSKCNISSEYKYLEKNNGDSKYHCKNGCQNSGTLRYLSSDYICTSKCEIPNNYVVETKNDNENDINLNECLSKCPSTKIYMRENSNKEYVCSDTPCNEENEFYYMNTNICMSECGNSLYSYTYNSKKYCVTSCDFFKDKILYHDDDNHKCVEDCSTNSDEENKYMKSNMHCGVCESTEFYFEEGENKFICLSKCPKGSMNENGNKICKPCSALGKYVDENGNCVDKCDDSTTGYIYHNEGEYNCLDKCSKNYIEDNTCVNSCSGTKPYIYENNCVDVCPTVKRFYLPDNKICLNDCPQSSKYYTISEVNSKNYYECQSNCDSYINNPDSRMNATYCLGEDCKDEYPFYVEDSVGKKICSKTCPEIAIYYTPIEGENSEKKNIKCLKECENNDIHYPESDKCIAPSTCETKFIKIKNKECVEKCSKNNKIFTNGDISYCADNCTSLALPTKITNVNNDLYLTTDDRCVQQCDQDTENEGEGKCECKLLFYFDTQTQQKKCLSISYQKCEDFEEYPISVSGENECVKYCDGTLSSNGLKCYRTEYNCDENKEKLTILTNGDKKCDCIEKYYYSYERGIKEKICLNKNENCPQSMSLLIKETKECVSTCTGDYSIKFENTCVSSCPPLTTSIGNECKCTGKFYIDKDNSAVCLENNCPHEYPFIIKDTNQCTAKCPDDKYLLYSTKECISQTECSDTTNREAVTSEGDTLAQQYAINKCRCTNNWYYDEMTGEEICPTADTACSELTNNKYKYNIYPTKQCVNSCTGDYKAFNNQCFKTCSIASSITNQRLTDDGDNKCKCLYYSKYGNNNICIDSENDCRQQGYSIINEIHQCYEFGENERKCPKEYPINFNEYCFKEESQCPSGTQINQYTQTCDCKGKWYKDLTTSKTVCVSTTDCPSSYPILDFTKKECIQSIPTNTDLYVFNYTLYSSCPENTEEGEIVEGIKNCICNKKKIWYKNIIEDKTYYFCAQKECPGDKLYHNEGEKECLPNCGTKKEYNMICYSNCPNLTEENNNKCILSPVMNNLNINNVEKTITDNLLDLYKKSVSEVNPITSSQKITTQDTTVEFYGVNKGNKGNKQDNIQSDLSYIDISECVDKIYKSNGMASNADIIILKFDIKNPITKYLVKPVEYKFINSLTGQELDASVCEHNSIKISYPLHDLISRYDNLIKKRKLDYMKIDLTGNNKDSLREKLDKGKEISQDFPDIDIFNINDKIYSDICIAVEINGKDLTLEDRINYFYPQMALCENNCTYNHTNFVNERIYCECSFKKEFDFKRNDEVLSFEISKDQINNDQGGNSNLAVLKCVSNLNYSKSLSGNGGFIFMLIVIIIEVALFFVIIFYGIDSILNKLDNKRKKEEENKEENDEGNNIEVVSIENENNQNEIENDKKVTDKDTQRKLNAPPKKKGEYDMEFIPQEYVFLFFNSNEKGVIKKVEKDSVPFKVGLNTRILLEKRKNVDYNNIKSRGPFPPNQNVLVIVDDLNDEINDYIYDENEEINERKNSEQNNINSDNEVNRKNQKGEKFSEKYNALKKYSKRKIQFGTSDYDPSDENYSELDFDEDENHEKGFIESIKKEQRFLKKDYEFSSKNQKSSNFVIMLFTEIIDKIYITKILLFTKKFDILSVQLSIYFLCHTILLIILTLFYDIKTISKIWNTDNYPSFGYYFLYGLLACIIVWIIYKIILCLWNNNDKIKEILKLIHVHEKYGVTNEKMVQKRCNNLACKIKLKIAIYTIIQSLLLAFCFVYFVTFCSVYTGTKSKVFKSYVFALIEILIIKIIYGIALAVLRRFSLTKEKKTLYNVVLFMNTYLV